MILEFELEPRTGNGHNVSYAIKRKGLYIGSLILFGKEYTKTKMTKCTITSTIKQ